MNLPDEVESQQRALKAEWLAEKLNISTKTLYRHANKGSLPCIRIRGCVRFNPKSVADWLRKRMND